MRHRPFVGDDYLALFEHTDMLDEAGQGHVVPLCRSPILAGPFPSCAMTARRGHRQGMKDGIKVSHTAN